MPRLIDSATSRAWAPSCRSRSIRRSSAAEWSTASARRLGEHLDPLLEASRCAVAEQRPVDRATAVRMIGSIPNHQRTPVTTSTSSSTSTISDDHQADGDRRPAIQTRSRQVIGSVSPSRRAGPAGRRSGSGRYGGGTVDAQHPARDRAVPVGQPADQPGRQRPRRRMPTQTTTSSAADHEEHEAEHQRHERQHLLRRRTPSAASRLGAASVATCSSCPIAAAGGGAGSILARVLALLTGGAAPRSDRVLRPLTCGPQPGDCSHDEPNSPRLVPLRAARWSAPTPGARSSAGSPSSRSPSAWPSLSRPRRPPTPTTGSASPAAPTPWSPPPASTTPRPRAC